MSSPEAIIIERTPSPTQAPWLDNHRELIGELRYNSLQNVLVGGLFALFFSQHAAGIAIWVWWASFALVVGLRSTILRWLEKSQRVQDSSRGPIIYSCIGATALIWGFAPLATGAAPSDILFLLAVSWVLIVVIGGVSALHAEPLATAALALPATFPSLIALLSNNERASFAVVLGIGLTYAHIIVGNVRARRARDIELALKEENAALLQKYETQARLASAELERRLHNERELRAARHRAEQLSSLDSLTGIANRRFFDEQLKVELARAFRAQSPLSVVLIDIDCFKQINDTLGHSAGDDCLATIGSVLQRFACRGGDVAARYGGEEFVLLLPASNLAAASRVAERARQAIVNCNIDHPSSIVADHLTASFGVASITPSVEHTPRELIDAADTALYEAKRSGRNRVVSAS